MRRRSVNPVYRQSFSTPEIFFVVAAWLRSVARSRWKNAFFGLNSRNRYRIRIDIMCYPVEPARLSISCFRSAAPTPSIKNLRLPLALTLPSFAVLPTLPLRS